MSVTGLSLRCTSTTVHNWALCIMADYGQRGQLGDTPPLRAWFGGCRLRVTGSDL
jgi:hypothetical protein